MPLHARPARPSRGERCKHRPTGFAPSGHHAPAVRPARVVRVPIARPARDGVARAIARVRRDGRRRTWRLPGVSLQFTITPALHGDCGRYRQSGLRPDMRLLRHPALEGVTRSARTDSPHRIGRKQISGEEGGGGGGGGGLREERRGGSEQFFETALVQGDDITGAVSGKLFSISQAQFARVFALPTEGVVNFSEVPKDKVYDARSTFSKKGVQVEIHGKKKHMKYEFRLLNDILAKAVTVKAGSFDAVTTERFQMMTTIHFGLKRKAKGFAAQIGVLLKGILSIALGDGVSFPFAKILSMKTVNTYITTNTTIDAREEQGMISEATVKRKPKSKKKSSSTDDTPVKVTSEIAGSKKRVAIEDNAPAIPKKRRTVKTKPSFSQAILDILNVAQDVVPIQVIDPTSAVATIKSPAPKRKSQKRRLVLPMGSDDETMGTHELAKDTDEGAVKPTDEVDITIEQVLEETMKLGVNEEEHRGQGVDETMFAEYFAQWLDDFVSRNSGSEIVGTRTITEVAGSTSPVVVKDMNRAVSSMFTNEELMSIDDLLLQISDDMLLPSITATEITKIRLGELFSTNEVQERDVHLTSLPRISSHDKGKAILEEDEPIRGNPSTDILSLSTQFGDIVDHIHGGDAKKGEIGSSSRRPSPVRVERRPLPTQPNQGESNSGHGHIPSVEEAVEMVREADRHADRREREREREKRLRRLRRRGH
ncbi:hypothetical protein F511_16623 [Dorcoceras hygrometricum]|uniref:Uncharacterized protein n=1 Tax=Dorcoceras hygrometricum TaxID=472368 RepID=A0A2Z7BTE1_9LAMI|nr:hypothetical protein F511_16623 [Dorcoceras hygrometricum]